MVEGLPRKALILDLCLYDHIQGREEFRRQIQDFTYYVSFFLIFSFSYVIALLVCHGSRINNICSSGAIALGPA